MNHSFILIQSLFYYYFLFSSSKIGEQNKMGYKKKKERIKRTLIKFIQTKTELYKYKLK